MSFSERIKTEILNGLSKNTDTNILQAEKFGEILTQALTKASLEDEFKQYMDIANLDEKMIQAVLKGTFLNSGCIVDPNTDYHLELIFKSKFCAQYIFNLLSLLEFTPKLTKRKNLDIYVVYIKDSEQISLFLSVIETSSSLLVFEEIRVEKNVNNNKNRVMNCKSANLSKTVDTANKQLVAIEKIFKLKKENLLNDKLQYTAKLRKAYPYESLDYISKQTIGKDYISKSGLKHRLDKIIEIADNLEDNK